MKLPLLFLALSAMSLIPVRAETYTYPQLVERLTDLSALAKLPPPGEKTALASSYNRASRYDAATGKYVAWDANGDGGGVIRHEGDDSVFMEVDGPGCIYRMWAATVGQGHVKIYLDGSPTPTIDLPFSGYFDGKTAPFDRPNLVYIPSAAAHGLDNYTPIPFQKSCRIVGEKDWGNYYHFTYTQFPPGTVVPTFNMALSAADSAALDRADKILGECGQPSGDGVPHGETETTAITAPAGKTVTVADLNGAEAITALKVKLDLPADPEAQRVLLHQLTLGITWDDETAPAVWTPLGDFFAYVGGADKFQSLPMGLLEDGTFYSSWYMPFGKEAHVEVGNDGPAPIAMNWSVTTTPLTEPIAKLARFHAKWHRDAFLPADPDRKIDWTLLVTRGRGRYVGTHLHGWNPRGIWWGEGDEKFFVDGEKFPSTYGTGSEDYFGYAWSSSGHFSRPYHNQILNDKNTGHFDDNRWHVSDSVPFDASFEGVLEKYFSDDRPTMYAAVAYWYLNVGGADPYPPVPVAERLNYWPPLVVYHEPDAIEAESLHPAGDPKPGTRVQDMKGYGPGWSGDQDLLWLADQVGQTVELPLPEQAAGKYRLLVQFTESAESGICQTSLNGADLGQPLDLFSTKTQRHALTDYGIVTLAAGTPTLKLTVTGKNEKARAMKVSVDFLKLLPVR